MIQMKTEENDQLSGSQKTCQLQKTASHIFHNHGEFCQEKGYLPDRLNLQHVGTKGRSTMGVGIVVLISVV